MKNLIYLFFVCLSFSGFGQLIDTAAVRSEVDSLLKVSQDFLVMGEIDKAWKVNNAAEKLTLEKLGNETLVYADICTNYGWLLFHKSEYSAIEKWWVKAKKIKQKVLGKEHLEYAETLHNLANLYGDLAEFEKMEPLHLEAIAIIEKVKGKEHRDYAKSLALLGLYYSTIGNYGEAERTLLEAKKIMEKIIDKDDISLTYILNYLGALYHRMGNYQKAEPLFLYAIAILEKNHAEEKPDYAWIMNNLSNLYSDMGKYEKAKPLLLKVKNIFESRLNNLKHPMYFNCLDFLAECYQKTGNFEKAESLYLQNITLREEALRKNHPFFTNSLFGLASLYLAKGNYEKAEQLYLETKEICEKKYGKKHPLYAKSLSHLANVYLNIGDYEKTELLFDELSDLNQFLITRALHHLSVQELNNYLKSFSESQAQIFSFVQLSKNRKFNTLTLCYDNTLFYKGFLLNTTQQVSRMAQTDSISTEMFLRLKTYNRRLAAEYAKPLAGRKSILELKEKTNTLEKELARSVAGFGDALQQVNWWEVQSKLKPGETVIEFIHYKYFTPNPSDSIMYAALLLNPEMESPVFIPLFEERQLHKLLSATVQSNDIAMAYTSRGLTPKKKERSVEGLYQLIWEPLEKYLDDVLKVYYSPSGLLHRINFDAIPINREVNLFDNYQLTRLGSSRSLVVPDHTNSTITNDAILYGGIEYEMDDSFVSKEGKDSTILKPTSNGELSFTYADRSLSQHGENWQYLPGTKDEINNIGALFNQSDFELLTYSGISATEESFKKIGTDKDSPRILHLATHGFFFPDPKEDNLNTQNHVFKISDHPMIRSGLILAGGNHAWETGKTVHPDKEDGILTSYEISQMNLSNTELVVLSACETGLGDIEGNEGVYGLQRAFKIAGVKYLIMSMWQVPDQHTQELMTLFYAKWLKAEMEIPEAFIAAQKELRKKNKNPYFWAGFVLVE